MRARREEANKVQVQVDAAALSSTSNDLKYPDKFVLREHSPMPAGFFKQGKEHLLPCEGHADWDTDIMGDSAWICIRDHLTPIYLGLDKKNTWLDEVFCRNLRGDKRKQVIAKVLEVINNVP